MGTQLKSFVPGNEEQLPFDMQLGFSKRLKKAPIQLSATAHHLHQFNLAYNDTAGASNGGQEMNTSTFNKLFSISSSLLNFILRKKLRLVQDTILCGELNLESIIPLMALQDSRLA
jgi:hypothetical protein